MQPENWKKVKEILEAVLALEGAAARREYLDAAGLSAEVRAEVESLLAFEEASEGLMHLSAVEFSRDFFAGDDELAGACAGQRIGPYVIERELGSGGMGAVYFAHRADGDFRQRVALKLLKREMNTNALRRRFAQERQILASLEHPHIARLLDAGTTDDNVPYLAMEYVEGVPIDDYCRRENLGLNERLDLFRKVCAAVSFAHRNLIVHRDLKPSNILVASDGTPKLLDFGISKILSAEASAADSATVTRLGAMTPSYASPEQLRGRSVTTATDIYSLGVILYELLSGRRPFDSAEEEGPKSHLTAVLEAEPPPPSRIVEQNRRQAGKHAAEGSEWPAAGQPSTPPDGDRRTDARSARPTGASAPRLNPQNLRGDLDNIVLKALRKEPERRYSSAESFAEDVRRHQAGLPVAARPNTFAYRAEKFFKRHRAGVFGGLLLALALIGGVAATLWQARVAQAERARAEKRFNDVRRLANSYLFDVYPEIENLEGSLRAREKILTNALGYLDSLSNEAGGDRELQDELATAYEKIGDVQGALNNSSLGNIQAGLDSYAKARALREAVLAGAAPNSEAKEKLANNYYVTARTLWNNSRTKDAEEMFERGLGLRRELAAAEPDSFEKQNRLAVLLIDYGAIPAFNSQAARALELFDEALAVIEKLRQKEPDNPELKKTLARLLRIVSKPKGALGDYDGALAGLEQALAVSRELAAQFPADFRLQRAVWLTSSLKCELFIEKQDGPRAVDACVPTIEFPRNALAKEPENGVVAYDLAVSHFNSARAERLAENYPQTVAQAQRAIEAMTPLSRKSPDNLEYKRNLAIYETEMARALLKMKQYERAGGILQKTIETMAPIAAADRETTIYRYDLAMAYRLSAQAAHALGDRAKAVEQIDRALAIIKELKAAAAIRDTDKNLLAEIEAEKALYGR